MTAAFQSFAQPNAFQEGAQVTGSGPTNYSLTCNPGSYAYNGTSATISRNRAATLNAGSYAYNGTSATISRNRGLTASSGSYAYNGTSATISRNKNLTASSGSYAYNGTSATISRNRSLTASSGSYAYNGSSATLTYTPASTAYSLTALSGSYAYTGSSVTFTYGQPSTATAPGGVRKKRQRRQYLEVDGKLVPFKSEADIYAYLDTVQEELVEEAVEVASKAAITVLKGENVAPPKAVIVPIEIIDSSAIIARVEQINKAIQQAYLRKLEIDAEMDDEEALLLLL